MSEYTNGIMHQGVHYAPAPPARRWRARIIDAGILVGASAALAALAAASAMPHDAAGTAVLSFILFYALLSMLLGLLYGWGAGIGQLMTRVQSRRTRDGRRVGGFRGWMRYWGIAFFPFVFWGLLISELDSGSSPAFWHDNVRVFMRRGTPGAHAAGYQQPVSQYPGHGRPYAQ